MATSDHTQNPSPDKIIGRNMSGDEVALVVVEKCGLICIQYDDDAIILPHAHAIELTLALVEALFKQHRRGEVGPFSSTF